MKKVYLAWQFFQNETKHLRRFSSDCGFLGYQKQDEASVKWIDDACNPVWPCSIDPNWIPFEIEQ